MSAMKYMQLAFIGCHHCGKAFGGPEAGDYSDWDNKLSGSTVYEYLADEALAMGWLRIIWGEDVLICSASCAQKWLKEAEKRGN